MGIVSLAKITGIIEYYEKMYKKKNMKKCKVLTIRYMEQNYGPTHEQ